MNIKPTEKWAWVMAEPDMTTSTGLTLVTEEDGQAKIKQATRVLGDGQTERVAYKHNHEVHTVKIGTDSYHVMPVNNICAILN